MLELGRDTFKPLSIDEAWAMQYRLVDTIRRHLDGYAQLQAGDYGVYAGLNRPQRTAEVEKILADFFGAEDAALVRGAGTGAIRLSLVATTPPASRVLIHRPPTYPTTMRSLESMGLNLVFTDLNDLNAVADVVQAGDIASVLIQHTYQSDDDHYVLEDVVRVIHQHAPDLPIVVDDNYAAFKIARIGVQQGADISTFSLFKLLGPEGVGLVLGRKAIIDRIHEINYSGGSQVQGPEAMDALRSLIYAPVAHAGAARVIEEILERGMPGVTMRKSLIQGVGIVCEFDKPIAEQVAKAAIRHGALPHPVGAESRYEMSPIFYRMSGTFRERFPERAKYMMRIGPMRAGADTVLNILHAAMADAGVLPA
jgi:hypothetical protein